MQQAGRVHTALTSTAIITLMKRTNHTNRDWTSRHTNNTLKCEWLCVCVCVRFVDIIFSFFFFCSSRNESHANRDTKWQTTTSVWRQRCRLCFLIDENYFLWSCERNALVSVSDWLSQRWNMCVTWTWVAHNDSAVAFASVVSCAPSYNSFFFFFVFICCSRCLN